MSEGIELELAGLDRGDARLSARARLILQALASDTKGSINAVCDSWCETKVAYRFVDSKKVTPETLREPHRVATVQRVQAERVVLDMPNTTELDYSAGCAASP